VYCLSVRVSVIEKVQLTAGPGDLMNGNSHSIAHNLDFIFSQASTLMDCSEMIK
jgi:hypothetical protein